MNRIILICLFFGLFLSGCDKTNTKLTHQDIELAKCMCKISKYTLHVIVRNNDYISFTCKDNKGHTTKPIIVWDDSYIEGCSK